MKIDHSKRQPFDFCHYYQWFSECFTLCVRLIYRSSLYFPDSMKVFGSVAYLNFCYINLRNFSKHLLMGDYNNQK